MAGWSRERQIGAAVVLFALVAYYLLHWLGVAFLDALWPGHGLEASTWPAVLLGPLFLALVLGVIGAVAAAAARAVVFAMGFARFIGHRLGLWDHLSLAAPEGAELRAHLGQRRLAARSALEALIGVGLLVLLGLLLGWLLVLLGGGAEVGRAGRIFAYALGLVLSWGVLRLAQYYWGRLDVLQADASALLARAVIALDLIGQVVIRWLNRGRIPDDD